jgi:SH3 domain protein
LRSIKWNLFCVFFGFIFGQGIGLAETMYVTDRLYLSLRSVADPEHPAIALLPSDTKVEVLETEKDWAKVRLEDGRTGWVMKRFLVEDLPKSFIIGDLKREVESRDVILERLQAENASLRKEISDRVMQETKEGELKKKIETLENQIAQQKKRFEMTTKENTFERLKEIYVPGMVALFVGLIVGYFLGKPKKKQLFP